MTVDADLNCSPALDNSSQPPFLFRTSGFSRSSWLARLTPPPPLVLSICRKTITQYCHNTTCSVFLIVPPQHYKELKSKSRAKLDDIRAL